MVIITDKKISMSDIARLSGVSIATVSRVLNHNGRFSAETERKVMEVVEKYNYTINPNAQGLRTNRTKTIGVIIPDITNEYFSQIVRSIENTIIKDGYNVFVCDTNEDAELEHYHVASLQTKGVEGIIYISTQRSVNEISKLINVPVVFIDRGPDEASVLVSSDNLMGGFLATEQLIKHGCKNILMLRDINRFSTVNNRVKGYVEALEKYGCTVRQDNIIPCKVSYTAAKEKIKQLIDSGVSFDGVFCNNDMMALGVLSGLKERKIKVPSEVKIVGFDGVIATEISEPPITTVIQNTEMLGQKAVEVLMKLVENDARINEEYVIPVTLSQRGST